MILLRGNWKINGEEALMNKNKEVVFHYILTEERLLKFNVNRFDYEKNLIKYENK